MFGVAFVLLHLVLGETLAQLLALPVPGPVLGLGLMILHFAVAGGAEGEVGRLFDAVAPHLTVLFVPAGAGVLAHVGLIRDDVAVIAVAVIAGTLVTIAVTAAVAAAVLDRDDAAAEAGLARDAAD